MSSVKKGDVIAISKPFACVILSRVRGERCETCLQRNIFLRKCKQCNLAFYCNSSCQKKSWLDHKLECKSLKKVHPRVPPDYILLLARVIRKLKRGGDLEEEKIGNVTRTFASLMSHLTEIQSDPKRREIFAVSYFVLSQFLEKDELPTAEIALEMLGKIFINTITVLDEQGLIASGLYLGPSALNHSCKPNVTVVFSGPLLTLRCLEDMPNFELSKAFISYIGLMDTTANRRKQLLEQFYFLCECQTCLDEDRDKLMHSVRCANATCTHPLLSHKDEPTCKSCGTVVSAERITHAKKMMKLIESKVEIAIQLKTNDEHHKANETLEKVLPDAIHLLHPLNVHLIKGLDEVFDTRVCLGDVEVALSYGLLTLDGFRKYAEYMPAMYGLQLAKIGKIQLHLNNLEDAKQNLVEANKQLIFNYGKDHPVYNRFKETLRELKEALDVS